MQTKIIRNLKKDKLISKCEKLLVKGTDSITDISEELGISYNTARGYIELVKSRWVDSKSVEELQSEREGLIKKVQEVIKESWQIKNTAKTALEASQALRTILMAVEQLRKLQGLDMLPLALDESDETKIFKMAQEVNKLPKNEYKVAMRMIEAEIIKKGGTDEEDFTYK